MKYNVKIPRTNIQFILEVEDACCYTCRYSHREGDILRCWGEKEPPRVEPFDSCDSWKEKDAKKDT